MDLKELFGEELATQVETIVKEKGVNLVVDNKEKPNYIPKARLVDVIGVKNELKTQVGELTNQLETLKESAKGNETLTKQIEELQAKNQDWEGKYKNTLLESAIKLKAVTNNAKDPDDLVKFLDMSKLEIDETGEIKGLDEQLSALKESKSYLFDSVQTSQTGTNPTSATETLSKVEKLQQELNEARKSNRRIL